MACINVPLEGFEIDREVFEWIRRDVHLKLQVLVVIPAIDVWTDNLHVENSIVCLLVKI